jgi:hypothetical protein
MPYPYEDGVLTQKMRKSCLSSSLVQPGLLQETLIRLILSRKKYPLAKSVFCFMMFTTQIGYPVK